MGKDMRLVNIYLKIHNKWSLTMDDLSYLAKYAPDCFEKTCQNVVYNFPESKPVMEPAASKAPSTSLDPEPPDEQNINQVLANIKQLETNTLPVTNVSAEQVKNLLGNLYMELLFPHNDRTTSLNIKEDTPPPASYDKKI